MKLIPTKKQWESWSLPSKLTVIGTVLGGISLLLAFAFEFNPFKQIIAVDNTKLANEYYLKSKSNEENNNYERMLLNIEKAYKLDSKSPIILEKYAYALFKNKRKIESIDILGDKKNELTFFSKWLYASLLSELNKTPASFSKNDRLALQIFEKLDVKTVPVELRMDALQGYLIVSYRKSKSKFKITAEKIIAYTNRVIEINSRSGKFEIIATEGHSAKIGEFNTNDLIFLPGIYFRISTLLIFGKSITVQDLNLSLNYFKRGASSGILTYNTDVYLFYFNKLEKLISKVSDKGTIEKCINSLELAKSTIISAKNGKIFVNGFVLNKKFEDEEINDINKCLKQIDKLQIILQKNISH